MTEIKIGIFPFFSIAVNHTLFASTSNSFYKKKDFKISPSSGGKTKGETNMKMPLHKPFISDLDSCLQWSSLQSFQCTLPLRWKQLYTAAREQALLWCKRGRSMKNNLIFRDNIMCSQSVQVWNSPSVEPLRTSISQEGTEANLSLPGSVLKANRPV